MNEKPSESDYRDLHRLVQELALKAYPNPDRNGCPGRVALEEVAALPLSTSHEVFQTHINRCSPCLKELLEIRKRLHAESRRRKRVRWGVGLSTAACFLALSYVMWRPGGTTEPEHGSRAPIASADFIRSQLDLSDGIGVRSDDGVKNADKPHQLAHARLDLEVNLPFTSPAGAYHFGVFRLDRTPVTETTGVAEIANSRTLLRVKLDLTPYPAGQYLVAARRPEGDWVFHEITVR